MTGWLRNRAVAPWLGLLIAATMAGQGVVAGARIADTRDSGGRGRPVDFTPTGEPVPSDEARARLCGAEEPPSPGPQPTAGGLPEPLQPVADAVRELRGLEFTDPVNPEPLTREEIQRRVRSSIEVAFPRDRMLRRTLAWRAMGVIPPNANLAREIPAFSTGTIIGYYDTISKELVYVGTEDPSPYERVTLAHELTHALDDQHFELSRLDVLDAACADDALIATVAAAEGSARLIETLYTTHFLTQEEYEQFLDESFSGGGPPAVSPFLSDLILIPYEIGERFIAAKHQGGGFEAVNEALRLLPASTEQVMHPDRFPGDEPTDVDAPDVSIALEGAWEEIDVYDVGEAWLYLALSLRLGNAVACDRCLDAVGGWDGGEYRAWRNGDQVAVLMDTVWDTPKDAADFLKAMRDYLGKTASGSRARGFRRGTRVVVMWAETADQLDRMAATIPDSL